MVLRVDVHEPGLSDLVPPPKRPMPRTDLEDGKGGPQGQAGPPAASWIRMGDTQLRCARGPPVCVNAVPPVSGQDAYDELERLFSDLLRERTDPAEAIPTRGWIAGILDGSEGPGGSSSLRDLLADLLFEVETSVEGM